MVRMERHAASERERPLRLSGIDVEVDVLLMVVGLRLQLVDVLAADRHESRVCVRIDRGVRGLQLRNLRREIGRHRQRAVLLVLEAVARDVARRLQLAAIPRHGCVDFRDARQWLIDQLADRFEARAVGVQLEAGLAAVVQRERAASADVEIASDDLERADVAGGVVVIAVYVGARDLQAAEVGRIEVNLRRPFHAVGGHALRHVGESRVDVQRPADGAFHLRVAARHRGIEVRKRPVRRDMRRIGGDVRCEVEPRDAASHQRRIADRPAGVDVHLLRRRPAPFGDQMGIDVALVAIVRQRLHVELLADALQIQIRDGRIGVVRDVAAVDRRADAAVGRDRRAGNGRRREAQINLHVPLFGTSDVCGAGHVIRSVHVRFSRRDLQLARHAAEVDVAQLTVDVEHDRLGLGILVAEIGQRYPSARRRTRAVRGGLRGQRDAPAVDLRFGVEGTGCITCRDDARRVEREPAAQ